MALFVFVSFLMLARWTYGSPTALHPLQPRQDPTQPNDAEPSYPVAKGPKDPYDFDAGIQNMVSIFANVVIPSNDSEVTIFSNSPVLQPSEWVSIGDSFAAGPGTGTIPPPNNIFPECIQGLAAYPLQLQSDPEMPGPNPDESPRHDFVACTGAVTNDILDQRGQHYQLGYITADTDFVTLSIGGNDVNFADILQRCVYGIWELWKSCETFLQDARDILYGQDFRTRYRDVLRNTLQNMRWIDRRTARTAVYQTGYSQFFESHTTQCNTVGFYRTGTVGPKVTHELRVMLNRLTHEVNYVMAYNMDTLNVAYTTHENPEHGGPGMVTPLEFVYVDFGYNRHRFCREDVQEPDLRNPRTWFWHLKLSEAQDPNIINALNLPDDEEFYNTIRPELEEASNVTTAMIPEFLVKTFHPTPDGMTRTKDFLLYPKLYSRIAHRRLPPHEIKIMMAGDYVGYASQDPASDIYQGFMPHLKALLRNREMYGLPWGDPRHTPDANFVGSQRPNHAGAFWHECYQLATLNELHQRLRASPALQEQGKVSIIMAGSMDIFYGTSLDDMLSRMSKIVIDILDADPRGSVLIGQIPMMGRRDDDGSVWRNTTRRIVEYNSRLAALADQLVAQGWRVMMVHTTTTTLEHDEGELVRPNRKGYLRMGYDYLQAITMVNMLGGWVRTSDADIDVGDTSGSPEPEFNVKDAVTCFEGPGVDIPSKEDIVKSITRGLDVETFINQVGCNATQICRLSDDGVYGGDDPTSLALNATICHWLGATDTNPNHAQITIVKPDTAFDIGVDECKNALRDLLDLCPQSASGYWSGSSGLLIHLENLNWPNTPLALQPLLSADIPPDMQSSVIVDDNIITMEPVPGPDDVPGEYTEIFV